MSRCRVRRFSFKNLYAAGTIAALSGTRSIGVKNVTAEIGVGVVGWRDHEDLVAANTAMPISQPSELGGAEIHHLGHAINNHKVIPSAMHFGKRKLHAGLLPGMTSRCHRASSVSRWPMTCARRR